MIRLAILLLAGCGAAATSGPRVVERAAAALGAGSLEEIRTLVLEGGGELGAFGQSPTHGAKILSWVTTEQRRAIDFEHRRWREDVVMTPAFVTGWPDPERTATAYDDGVAFGISDGAAARQDVVTAVERRADFYHHPIAWLRAARAPGAVLENARREGDRDAIDLVVGRGERFTLLVDRATKLPVRIASLGHSQTLGDVAVTTDFGDYADVGGWRLPRRITKRIEGVVVADFRVARQAINAPAGELAAPPDVRAAADRRTANVTVEEAAPGVWYLAGEGHHSVVVEFADHLTLIEAPADQTRTRAVIAATRALRPGKPLIEVVNTHHHSDHSGGIRTAIAEGLTLITHESNRAFFARAATRPSTVIGDALALAPRPAKIETVGDARVLTDGMRRLELYVLTGSAHCPTMLIAYLPAERLLVEADAYQPTPDGMSPPKLHPYAANLVENLRRRGLAVERVLPLHGRIVPYAELAAAALTSPR